MMLTTRFSALPTALIFGLGSGSAPVVFHHRRYHRSATDLVAELVANLVAGAKPQKSAIFPYISTFLPSLKGEKNNRENGKSSGKFAGSGKLVVGSKATLIGGAA